MLAIVLVFAVLIILAGSLSKLRPKSKGGWGSRAASKTNLIAISPFSDTEAKFFRRLVEALPEALVVPQMAMSALIDVAPRKKGAPRENANIRRSSFSQKRLDFVVLDRESLEVACVIELDDHTHDTRARRLADAKRDALLEGVGYTVLRFDCRNMPTASQLRQHLLR